MIWKHALVVPKLLCLGMSSTYGQQPHIPPERKTRPPTASKVCHESWEAWMSMIRNLSDLCGTQINPEIDTVWIEDCEFQEYFIRWTWLCKSSQRSLNFLEAIPRVRELTIVLLYRVDKIDPMLHRKAFSMDAPKLDGYIRAPIRNTPVRRYDEFYGPFRSHT